MSQLRDSGRLEQVGGSGYVTELLTNVTSVSAKLATDYAETIREKSKVRDLINVCSRAAIRGAHGGYETLSGFVEEIQNDIYSVDKDTFGGKDVDRIGILLQKDTAALRDQQSRGIRPGISTGFTILDRLTGGWHSGDLTLLAGRPGKGKTSLAGAFAKNAAKAGFGTAFFSLEMPGAQVAQRLACEIAGINTTLIRTGSLSSNDWVRYEAAASIIGTWPLWLDDRAGLTVADIRRRCKRIRDTLAREGKELNVVLVDYLQLLKGDAGGSREQEVSSLSRGLKALAKDMGVAVIALSQLNRAIESGSGRRPQLSDLRESGALEQDSDSVLMLFEPSGDEGEVIDQDVLVRKNRHGSCGSVPLKFEKAFCRYIERC
jgi:replicative DNA helicase